MLFTHGRGILRFGEIFGDGLVPLIGLLNETIFINLNLYSAKR